MKISPIISNKVAIVNNNSALGDTVCTLPIIVKMLKDESLYVLIIDEIWLPIYRDFVPSDKLLIKQHITDEITLPVPIKYTWVPVPSSIAMHLIDYSSIVLAQYILLPEDRNYPYLATSVPSPVSGRYAVINITHSSELKSMRKDTLRSIADHLSSLGITPVVVGKKYKIKVDQFMQEVSIATNTEEVPENCIDLVDKTDLHQLYSLVHNAEMVISPDSGVVHLAGLSNTKIVCIYTHKDPRHLMPIRNQKLGWKVWPVTPPASSCRFCMSQKTLPLNNFSFCAKGDLECVSTVSNDTIIAAISAAINNEGDYGG